MTSASLTDKIRTLHAETIAAIEQRQTLAVEARSALIATCNRLICRPGCEDALATWGLEPLPQRWTVSAEAQLSHTRSHTDHHEARKQARFGVPDELRLLQPAMAVYPKHVIDVTPVPNGSDQPGPQRYRITAQVTLQTWVTATREADAYEAARAIVEGHLSTLADAGITLTALRWQAADGPDDVPQDDIDADAPAVAGAAQLTELADDLTAATAARDAAVQALADLRRSIRARAIRALVDDEIGGIYQHTAQRVDRLLVDLGLDRLPQAHHVTVVADLTLPAGAGTAREACDAARDVMRAATTSSPDETRPWTAYGWTIPEYATRDQDSWRIPWRHEYDMWLRGHATSDDATAMAEVLARADLAQALAGIDYALVTVTASVETVGIDLYLDPDSD
ncbi:hypothetical protein [Micromonospora deserti]|uniref:Uncharacterized protein n=1 Tax=Micromonospora deserti TaxID=2070366 RepID=A0A2W2CWA9_9ACTN|nr:hypothetical protein [Micromonospora deserti]PZG02793.1 hypothetical protein C1I99_01240 [Micromonospora deserti]